MRISLFAALAASLVLLMAACSGGDGDGEVALGQGEPDSILVGEGGGTAPVDRAKAQSGNPGGEIVAGTGTLPGITVTGSGSVQAVPDVAEWSFGVQSDAQTAAAALESASSGTESILAALREAGIRKEDLRTEQVSIYPRTSDDGRSVVGYTASSTVHATIRGLDRAGSVVDAAVAAGANQVYGPTLQVSDAEKQYEAALAAALDDARARAEALAARAGVTLGGPVAIVESGGSPVPLYDRALAGAESAVPIEPGVQEIAATLVVTFAIT